ncbi:unnamed protein product [Calypogeia fissa]
MMSVALGKVCEKKANIVVGASNVQAMINLLVEHTDNDKKDDNEAYTFDTNWVRSVIGDRDVTLISGLPELYGAKLEEYRFIVTFGLSFNKRLQAQLKKALDHIGEVNTSTKKKEEELQHLHEALTIVQYSAEKLLG